MLLGYSVTLAARNRRKVGKNIGRTGVRASGLQPCTQPKAVMRWAQRGIGLVYGKQYIEF